MMSLLKEPGMRASRVVNERGVALAVAVFALVVIGALVAATFFAGRLEQQTGQNSVLAVQAGQVSEAALGDALTNTTILNATSMNALVSGAAASALPAYTPAVANSHVTATRSIQRLANNLFLLSATGQRTNSAGTVVAQQTLAQLIRLNAAEITVSAGLTALGDVKVTGGAEVSGIDAVPPLWAAQSVSCPPTADQAGVRYNNGTVSTSGSGAIEGAPASIKDLTLNTSQMQSTFNQLKALATLTVASNNPPAMAPAYTGNPQKCDASVESNWGEPAVKTDPCFNYFPIIYHNGDLKLQGGRGQGILLVEGDLTATGGMVFYGPVFVTGTLSTTGNSGQGAKFFGGVIAGNVALDDLTKLAGGALVNYSSCAIKRALGGSATPASFSERGFVQLYGN
jgi:hypothetical protein